MIKKKDIIALGVLGGILLALILVYAFLVAPLLKDDDKVKIPPEIFDGEFTNGMTVSLYAPISDADLLEIAVKNDTGEYAFIQQKDENGKISMVIKGHEKLAYDNAVYAYLSVFAKEPKVPLDGTIVRKLTDAEMATYGTTEELCKAQVTVKYKDKDAEKEYTLFIGDKVMSSNGSYYVAVKGRNNVYCVNSPYVENAILKGLPNYISPAIYSKYKNASEAAIAIKQFIIMKANQVGDSFGDIIMLEQDNNPTASTTSASFKFTFPDVFPQKIVASNDYVLSVLGLLYTNFSGESVVAVDPDQATLEKYGLGKEQEQYMIYASLKEPKDDDYIPTLYVSKEFIEGEGEDAKGYHYIMSGYHARVTIVKIPSDQLKFLKNDTQTMLDWAATNSIFAGFNQYLRPEIEVGAPGVKQMRIRLGGYNETFDITLDKNGLLTAKSQSGKYVFKDNIYATEAYTTNQFSNLYSLLLYFPMPSRYTELDSEGIKSIKTDENIIYELEVVMNDDTLYKYTYYTLDEGYAGYALCESSEGKINEDGEWKYSTTQAIFDVKSRQIGKIAEAYKIILEGGSINPRDYIY